MSKENQQPVKAFDLYKKSVDLIKKNQTTFLVLAALPALLSVFSSAKGDKGAQNPMFPFSTNMTPSRLGAVLGVTFIAAILVIAVILIVYVMTEALYYKAAKGQKPSFGELWEVAKKYILRLLGLGIVTALAIVGGLILLIVPGIIAIRRYILAPYVMLDKDMGILDSMSESARLTKPYSMSVYSLLGVSILLSIVAGILQSAIGVVGSILGLLLTLGYAFAPAIRYFELVKLDKK